MSVAFHRTVLSPLGDERERVRVDTAFDPARFRRLLDPPDSRPQRGGCYQPPPPPPPPPPPEEPPPPPPELEPGAVEEEAMALLRLPPRAPANPPAPKRRQSEPEYQPG